MSNTDTVEVHTVEIHHQGKTYTIEVPGNKTILRAAEEAKLDLPNSCNAGVCTTCAAQVMAEGTVDQSEVWELVQNSKRKVMYYYVLPILALI